MSVNSNKKGKRGERLIAKVINECGDFEARRSQQYSGVSTDPDSADLIHSIPNVRIEVKFGYNTKELWHKMVQGWIQQARDETPAGKRWMIIWKRDYKKPMAIFYAPFINAVVMTDNICNALNYSSKDAK